MRFAGNVDLSLLDNFGLDGPGGSIIKSIQRGEGTLGGTTANITLSPVNLGIAIPRVSYYGAFGGPNNDTVSATLTTITNLRLVRANSGEGAPVYNWEVIEFNNVKSLQTGVVTLTSNVQNVAISSVDVNKTLVFPSFHANSGMTPSYTMAYILNSSTNIKFTSYGHGVNFPVCYYVIEFN